MKSKWFKLLTGVFAGSCLGAVLLPSPNQAWAYQDASTPTGIFITVTYTDPMNVRNGPGTFYDIIGQIFPGDVFPAIGISPGREWIQISYAQGQGGVGWVYSAYVSVSGGELQIVEPPPTPAPLTTNTIDPTLAAAFNIEPTPSRRPTFTPPPPLTVPQFTEEATPRRSPIRSGYFILVLGVFGAAGLIVSFIFRR
ncbi:MAG TPA: SH3 domain-containing protein [Anaerolineales bacterium]|nr:SH3 domain-containing protein [Anaerolineales bacterium]